jgi:hypothetical protein
MIEIKNSDDWFEVEKPKINPKFIRNWTSEQLADFQIKYKKELNFLEEKLKAFYNIV